MMKTTQASIVAPETERHQYSFSAIVPSFSMLSKAPDFKIAPQNEHLLGEHSSFVIGLYPMFISASLPNAGSCY